MFKKFNRDTSAMSQTAMVAVIAVALIALVFVFGSGNTPTTGDVTGGINGEEYSADLTVKVRDWNGDLLNAGNVKGYLIPAGEYTDIYDAYEAYADSELASPFGGVLTAPSDSVDANGELEFGGVTATDAGVDYGIFLIDTDSGVGASNYNMALYTITVVGDEAYGLDTVKLANSETSDNVGDYVVVSLRGDVEVYDEQATERTSYTWDTAANATLEDKDMAITFTLDNNAAVASDVQFYVSEVDDYDGTSDITLNSITMQINGGEIVDVDFKEVDDLGAKEAAYKNRPTVSAGAGTATTYVIEDLQEITRQKITNRDSIVLSFNFDADNSAATTDDQSRIVFSTAVQNGNDETEFDADSFAFIVDEDAASTGYA